MPNDISASLRARLALEKAGFRFTHSLGQNFIFDEALLDEIARCAGADEGVNVLEIGPGAGLLTSALVSRGARVLAIELDRALAPVLEEVLGGTDRARVVFADAMRADIPALADEAFGGQEYVVAANLPYYITADFIARIIALNRPPRSVTVMVQREAAERILAKPGDEKWCALAALSSFYCTGEWLMDVGRDAFTPPPHVDSALIRLTGRDELVVNRSDERAFAGFIKSAFAMRRKTLANNLSAAYGFSKTSVEAALENLDLDKRTRGESLTLESLSQLFYALKGDA